MARKQNHVKLCLWTHVQNESHIILNMLESAVDYIDYWVLIDNGSNDNTREIIKDFFAEKGIEGRLYQSEIGWKGHGINRQHSWDFLNKTDHGCDYILRIDADEILVVDDNFDWSEISGHEAYEILFDNGSYAVPRMWLWRANLPWAWQDDLAHETIYLTNGKDPDKKLLPFEFKQSCAPGTGNSYSDPVKYVKDVLKLEMQMHDRLANGSCLENEIYHLKYLCKSFIFIGLDIKQDWADNYFLFGRDHIRHFLERGIYYYNKLVELYPEEWEFLWERSQVHRSLNNIQEMISDLKSAVHFGVNRSEPALDLLRYYQSINDFKNITKYAKFIKNSDFKIEDYPYGVLYSSYYIYNKDLKREIDNILNENYIKVINGLIFI